MGKKDIRGMIVLPVSKILKSESLSKILSSPPNPLNKIHSSKQSQLY